MGIFNRFMKRLRKGASLLCCLRRGSSKAEIEERDELVQEKKCYERSSLETEIEKSGEVITLVIGILDEIILGLQEIKWHLVLAIAASSVGSAFQHGYNVGVINAPHQLIKDFIKDVLSDRSSAKGDKRDISNTIIILIWSTAVSAFCVGGMLGSALTGLVAKWFGLKVSLLLNNIIIFGAALLQGISKKVRCFELIILGRFLIGLSAGIGTGIAPMYLSEISPTHLRGAVSSVYSLLVVISIFVSQVLGLSEVLGSEELWPFLLGFTAVPAMFMLVTLPFCPESPKFLLIRKGQEMNAEKSLSWLRGTTEVRQEMEDMKEEYANIERLPKVTLREMFARRSLRIPLVICMVLMLGQQLSGINAIFSYSADIFKSAGLSDKASQYATLAIGTINVPVYVILLPLIEMAGRKTLLLIGFGGMFVDTILLTACLYIATYYKNTWILYFCVVLVIINVIMFAIGGGTIPLVLINELFSQSARPLACSIGFFLNWLAYFLVGLTFLPIKEVIGVFALLVFAVFLFGTFIFAWKTVPETKQRPIPEIIALFEN